MRSAGAGDQAGDGARTYEQVQKEMEGLMATIMGDDVPAKAKEEANIQYERLALELERMPQYQDRVTEQRLRRRVCRREGQARSPNLMGDGWTVMV
jgi:hypothetical protein